MRSQRLHETHQPLQLEELPTPAPASEHVLVKLKAAALNHRDCWIMKGMYPGIRLPVTLGSDGAGVIEAVGPGVDDSLVGREVIINPGIGWGSDPESQSADFEILGMPSDGTFSTHVVVPTESLCDRPSHLAWTEAAALPLAGVTAFRALFTRGRAQAGQNVLVTGIGGGVATFAMQFALAAKANVFVTSSSEAKINAARQAGASEGFLYTEDDWHKQARKSAGAMDVIIDSAGGPGYAHLIDLAKPAARIVNYGSTAGSPDKLDMFKLFWKQLSLCGSTMGSPQDFREMVTFVEEHEIRPKVDQVLALDHANEAVERMDYGEQCGKLVLRIED